MNNYRITVYPGYYEDGTLEWSAVFPDIPGVGGAGETPEQAKKDAYANLDVYLEMMEEEGR